MIKDVHILDIRNIEIKNNLSNSDYKSIYRDVYTIRHMESVLSEKYKSGEIRGFCHLVIGQENIYVALKQVLNENDKVIGSYRCHGLAYVCGISPREIIGECMGKQSGNCKGKGGSMHLYNDMFYGGHGIVGAQVSLGTGIAFGLKYKRLLKRNDGSQEKMQKIDEMMINQCKIEDVESHGTSKDEQETFSKQSEKVLSKDDNEGICFVFFGDGASNQGQVFESYNMAKLWNLPVVYVVENNLYGMWTPSENVCSYMEYYKRGINIPGIRVTDSDINILISVFKYASGYARMFGPIIIQIDTYRTCSHSCIDFNERYRTKEEVDMYLNNDCLKNYKQRLGEETVKSVELKVEDYIKEIVQDVERDSYPDEKELYTDVIKR